jgi:putative phosphoribosyl transferase
MACYLQPDIVELPEMRDRLAVFEDRHDAGRILAPMLEPYRDSGALLLGIPAGGVPVAIAIAQALGLEMDVAVVSKITLPWNSEVGYGGAAYDGTLWLNEDVLRQARLSEGDIQRGIRETQAKVARRERLLRGDLPPPSLVGRVAILVDDGLATGSTMRVAVRAVRRAGAAQVVVAVPTGHEDSVIRLARGVTRVYCPNIRGGWSYAVAAAYRNWGNLGESDVATLLAEYRASILAGRPA